MDSDNEKLLNKQNTLNPEFLECKNKIEYIQNQLAEFEYGKIIGDGRSDFTQQNHIYEFKYENKIFNLIDVPGIEGSEKKVNDQIWEAVKKSHAIFYVTSKPARPQTGDAIKKGTLEKIEEHLGIQTEVWAVYNKRINNPRQIGTLVSDDEKNSLDDLDNAFTKAFGKRYQGYIPISALPAFLATSECLAENSDRYKQREKFSKEHSKTDVLSFSNLNHFTKTIESMSDEAPKKYVSLTFLRRLVF